MTSPRAISKVRLAVALLVSISIHAAIGFGWYYGRSHSPAAGIQLDVRVESPDDPMTMTLRVEPKPVPVAKAPPAKSTEPRELPPLPSAVGTAPSAVIPATSHSGPSSAGADHFPKTPVTKPLHGNLKPGKTIVYVLDRSASMGIDALLPRAVAALNASLAQLRPDVRFRIVAYNGSTTVFGQPPLPATESNVEAAGQWLSRLTAEGRSEHRSALREAIANGPDVVFLLTDADDLDESDIQSIRKLIRAPVVWRAAVFGGRRTSRRTPLEALVAETGGQIQFVEGSQP